MIIYLIYHDKIADEIIALLSINQIAVILFIYITIAWSNHSKSCNFKLFISLSIVQMCRFGITDSIRVK